MSGHIRANAFLLLTTLVFCAVLYPLALLGIGQAVFANQAQGSLILGPDGRPLGSSLIAQPFTGDEYFQPRPSAASYNGAASGASNWGASNYLLRDRVARQLGPLVKYQSGPNKGKPVGPDVEAWFQQDRFQGQPGIVAQWAQAHSTLAANWVKADKLNVEYVTAWQATHQAEVEQWRKENPGALDPKPEDLAVPFFKSFSATYPGRFPEAMEVKTKEGKTEKRIEPVKEGTTIQSVFFDLWRTEHPRVELEPVPADMVMASASGLDPHITLKNARYQLDRVASKRAESSKRDVAQVRQEIEQVLNQHIEAPLAGLVGDKLVNVLKVNLALRDRYAASAKQ